MPESIPHDFAPFLKEKIRPAVDTVLAAKRLFLYLAFAVSLGLFLVFAVIAYFPLLSYHGMASQYATSYWFLMLFIPSAASTVGFCLVYILGLRYSVNEFQASVLSKLGDFIAFGTVHEAGKTLPSEELEGILLSSLGGTPFSGINQFHCRISDATAHFSTLRVKRKGIGAKKKAEMLTGLYFYSVMAQKFAVPIMVFPSSPDPSESGFETRFRAAVDIAATCLLRVDNPPLGRQFLVPCGGEEFILNLLSSPAFMQLEDSCRRGGAELYVSCQSNCLRVALLSPCTQMDSSAVLDEFDFEHCREFCRDVRLCLDLAFDMSQRNSLWLERNTTIEYKALSLA